jgi:hypothetical protein
VDQLPTRRQIEILKRWQLNPTTPRGIQRSPDVITKERIAEKEKDRERQRKTEKDRERSLRSYSTEELLL